MREGPGLPVHARDDKRVDGGDAVVRGEESDETGSALVQTREGGETVVGDVQGAQGGERWETLESLDAVGREVELDEALAARAKQGIRLEPCQSAAVHAERREVGEGVEAHDLRQRRELPAVARQGGDGVVGRVGIVAQVYGGEVERISRSVERASSHVRHLIVPRGRATQPSLLALILRLKRRAKRAARGVHARRHRAGRASLTAAPRPQTTRLHRAPRSGRRVEESNVSEGRNGSVSTNDGPRPRRASGSSLRE